MIKSAALLFSCNTAQSRSNKIDNPKKENAGAGALAESWREITTHPEDVRPVFRNFLSSASLRLCARFHFGI